MVGLICGYKTCGNEAHYVSAMSLIWSVEKESFPYAHTHRETHRLQCHGAVLNQCQHSPKGISVPLRTVGTSVQSRACYSAVGCIRICLWGKKMPDFSGDFWKWLWVLSGVIWDAQCLFLHLQDMQEAPFVAICVPPSPGNLSALLFYSSQPNLLGDRPDDQRSLRSFFL